MERFPHRGSAPSSTHQPERLVCSPTGAGGGWEPRPGLRSDHRERTGAGGVTQPEGASVPQLAGREPEKNYAAAEEARDFFLPLCFAARKERGFRAPPK